MTNKVLAILVGVGLAVGVATGAHAQNLVTNGSFESTTNGGGQEGYNTDATDWSTLSSGYNFIFTSGSADTTGVTSQYGNLQLWGPNNGAPGSNTLPATSPDGGNYVAADGAFQTEPIFQTINGLTVGQTYDLTFWWGAAQQYTYNGQTTNQWLVSLGDQTFDTPVDSIDTHGFSGWQQQTFTYTPDSSSEVLSFLANGTPTGEPPFALLDGVNLFATPEPSSVAVLVVGAIGLCLIVRRRTIAKNSSM